MGIEDWKSQIKRGTLEFCILMMIDRKSCYGYEIISMLDKWPILAAKESTVYPLLRRLLKEGYLASFWQETMEGLPPRKYYTITEQGKEYLDAMAGAWGDLLVALDGIRENGGTEAAHTADGTGGTEAGSKPEPGRDQAGPGPETR